MENFVFFAWLCMAAGGLPLAQHYSPAPDAAPSAAQAPAAAVQAQASPQSPAAAAQALQPSQAQRPAAQAAPLAWSLLWTGAWEESRNLHSRGDFRLGLPRQGLLFRAQALDRRALNFEAEETWGDFSQRTAGGAALGLYHTGTGSRLLHGALRESGLPARIRSPWSRSAPFAEGRRPISADLRTASSAAMSPEAYLYLSTPRLRPAARGAAGEISLRGFASAQAASEGSPRPALSCGIEASRGPLSLLLEGFFAGDRLPAREGSAWFSDPPPLPERDFRLAAGSLLLRSPHFLLAGDLAASSAFAFGSGFYGSAAIRASPPLFGAASAGRWSLSLAAEGMSERYVDRAGAAPGGGLRAAGRVERRGGRGSLLRAEASFRAPALDAPPDRSSASVSYRFPAPPARGAGGGFSLRPSRASLGAGRNASNPASAQDSIDAALGLSLAMPPIALPPALLPHRQRAALQAAAQQAARAPGAGARAGAAAQRARPYPLGIGLSASLRGAGSGGGPGEAPSAAAALPFSSSPSWEFESLRVGCELSWSPGILQMGARWRREARAGGGGKSDGSLSAAVRFRRGRFSARAAWTDFREKPSYTLSWRMEI